MADMDDTFILLLCTTTIDSPCLLVIKLLSAEPVRMRDLSMPLMMVRTKSKNAAALKAAAFEMWNE
jgi:hypothetical protein